MSVQALAWVLEEAPDLPAHLVGVLIGVANHAGRDGTGSYATQETLARYARKSSRAVRNDLDALLSLGLVRKGDQRLVAHLPADKRPVVYDLAMERTRPERETDRKPTSGRSADDESAGSGTAAGSTVPPGSRRPAGSPPSSGRKWASPAAGSGLPTEPSLNRPEPPPPTPSSKPTAGARADVESGGGDSSPDEQLASLVAEIVRARPEWKPEWIVRALTRSDVAARPWPIRSEAARLVLLDPDTKQPGRLAADGPWWGEAASRARRWVERQETAWCGECDENTRQITRITRRSFQGHDQGEAEVVERCPNCHPSLADRRPA